MRVVACVLSVETTARGEIVVDDASLTTQQVRRPAPLTTSRHLSSPHLTPHTSHLTSHLTPLIPHTLSPPLTSPALTSPALTSPPLTSPRLASLQDVYAVGDIITGAIQLTPVAIAAGRLLSDRLFNGAPLEETKMVSSAPSLSLMMKRCL